MKVLKHSDDRQIKRKSSIDQYRDKFSIYAQGGWLPISYDVIETIGCNGIKSHKAILSDNPDDLGYHFPIAKCKRFMNKYIFYDKQDVVIEELPEWFGTGLYEAYEDKHVLVNADNGALGMSDTIRYRVGLDYYVAKKILPAA